MSEDFPTPEGPGEHRGLSPDQLPYLLQALALVDAHQMDAVAGPLVHGPQPLHLLLRGQIGLVEADLHRQGLPLHHHQKPVQQIEIGGRIGHRKNHQRLVRVGYRRADQAAGPGEDGRDVSRPLLLADNINLHIVAHQGLYLFISENSFGFALIDLPAPVVDVVESGNAF